MPISLLNSQSRPVRTKPLLTAVRQILRAEGSSRAEVSIVLTDDQTIQRMNRDYRSQDKPTDVLSFSQRETLGGEPEIPRFERSEETLGDVVISIDTAERQALEHGIELEDELAMLAVHGILHLLGYEDETEGGAEIMQLKECEALNTVGIPHRRDPPSCV